MPTAPTERKTVTIVESKVQGKVKEGERLEGLLQRPNTPALNVARGSDMFLNDNRDNECNCYCRCAKRCAQKCELTKLKQGTGTCFIFFSSSSQDRCSFLYPTCHSENPQSRSTRRPCESNAHPFASQSSPHAVQVPHLATPLYQQ